MTRKQLVEKWGARRVEFLELAKSVHAKMNDEAINEELDGLEKECKLAQEKYMAVLSEHSRNNHFFGRKARALEEAQLRAKEQELFSRRDKLKRERDRLYDAITYLTDEETMALVIETLVQRKVQKGSVGGYYEEVLARAPYFQRKFSAYNNRPAFLSQLNRALEQLEAEGQITDQTDKYTEYDLKGKPTYQVMRIIRLTETVPCKYLDSHLDLGELAEELYPAIMNLLDSSENGVPLQEIKSVVPGQYGLAEDVIPVVLEILIRLGVLQKRLEKKVTYGEYQEKKYKYIDYIEKGPKSLNGVREQKIASLIRALSDTKSRAGNEKTKPTIEVVDKMEGHQFEHFCADLLSKSGFTDVVVTKGSGDQGVDVVAVKDHIRYAIQCKCYSSTIGNTPVQEVSAGKQLYKCHVGVVLTNQYFTAGAKELAEATGVLLWDRDELQRMIERVESTT